MKILKAGIMLSLVATLVACSDKEGNTTNSASTNDKNNNGTEVVNVEKVEFNFAHGYTVGQHTTAAYEKFAEGLAEKSKSNVKASLYPAGQLYNDENIVEAVSSGQVQVGATMLERLSSIMPLTEIVVLPIFDDYSHLHRALDGGLKDLLVEEFAKMNLYPITFGDYGGGYYASKDQPLDDPEDYKGLQIRTTSPLMSKYVEALGGIPVTLPGAEVLTALQKGSIDAALSAPVAFLSQQYYEMTKHYVGPVNLGLAVTFVNLDWWNSLDESTQQLILEESAVVEEFMGTTVANDLKATMDKLSMEGMDYTAIDYKKFEEAKNETLEAYYSSAGEAGKKAVEIIEQSR